MATVVTQWIAEFIDKITSPVEDVTDAANGASDAVEKIGKAANSAGDELKKLSATDLKSTADSIRDLTQQFEDLMAPGMAFEVKLKEVQAVTEMADKEMNKLGKSAKTLSEEFGGNATAALDSFGAIIARFGPAVAQDTKAMESMGRSVLTTSKLMGNDAVGAMDALTTAMLQFGVDINNPTEAAREMERMMHVMAAAGNEGASEVADTSQALKNAGVASKNANLSFEETNAALQALAQGGRTGAEAGVSLRNVLGKMGGLDIIPRRAQEKLKELGVNYDIISNKTLPFIDRLNELKKAQGDATLIAQIFGIENEAAVNILLDRIDMQDEITKAITNTSAATEGASIIMSSQTEQIGRWSAWLDNLKISLFEVVGGLTPFIVGLGTVAFTIANLAAASTGIAQLITFIRSLTIATHLQAAAQWVWNIAMSANPIGLIIMAIGALITIIAVAITYYEDFGATLLFLMGPIGWVINGVMALKNNWDSVVEAFESEGIMGAIKRIGIVLFDAVLYPVQQLLEILGKIPGIGKYAAMGAEKIGNLRNSFNLATPEASPDDEPEPEPAITGPLQMFQYAGAKNKTASGGLAGKGSKEQDGVTLGGNGGTGGGKTINMTVNNYINGFRGTKELAEEVANVINNSLSDGLAVV